MKIRRSIRFSGAALLAFSLAAWPAGDRGPQAGRLVGYYGFWNIYERNYQASQIPANLLTHINYAFAGLSKRGVCISLDRRADEMNLPALRQLKHRYPSLMTLISVGGANDSRHFSAAARTPASRRKLAQSCILYMRQRGFDGIDMDWEFPSGDTDRENFTALLAELRGRLNAQAAADGRQYLLTIAAPTRPEDETGIDFGQIHPYVDWINLMAYDFYSFTSPITNFDAPLYASSGDPAPPSRRLSFNVDAAVKTCLAAGVPRAKLVLGVHFSGHGWKQVPNIGDGLYQRNGGPAKGISEEGVFDYRDLKKRLLNGYQRHWHDEAKVPWLYDPAAGIMISYDDPESLGLKAEYAREHHLGGIMVWQLSGDDEQDSLLKALWAHLHP